MALPRWPAVLSVTQDAFLEVERLRWCLVRRVTLLSGSL